jgi:hypothetical protein
MNVYSKPACFSAQISLIGVNQGGSGEATVISGQVPTACTDSFPLDSYSFFITELAGDQKVHITVESDNFDVYLKVETPDQDPAICADDSTSTGSAGKEEVEFIANETEGIGIFVFAKSSNVSSGSYTLTVVTDNQYTLDEDDNFVDCQIEPFGC